LKARRYASGPLSWVYIRYAPIGVLIAVLVATVLRGAVLLWEAEPAVKSA
jgi:hypothetical protein